MRKFTHLLLAKLCLFATLAFFSQCSDDEILKDMEDDPATHAASTTDCGCTYTVPSNTYLVDGAALGIKPGAVICLKAGNTYKNIVFRNIKGTSTLPITIKNCGGTALLNATGWTFGLKTEKSQYFRITGGTGTTYGIKITGGHESMQLISLSSDFEIDHVEISNSGFAGIMAKTDPTCDNSTNRGYFYMRNISIHDNYIHDTGGEGMYIGHTFYIKGVTLSCGVRYPHTIEGLKIFRNKIKNSGWESIQVGSTTKGLEVYENRIENYGAKNYTYQNNAVQFGEGSPGVFYGNFIKGGSGHALMVLSNADHFAHDNIIINAGADAIFCEERDARGAGFRIVNNTIIKPKGNGITLYSDYSANYVYNNIIVDPGKYSSYAYPRTGNDAYIYKLSKTMNVKDLNNYKTRDINSMKFTNILADDFSLLSSSPAVNKGYNISTYNILVDYRLQTRLKGTAYDIGANEY
jgi:hypothetical protein